MTPPATSNGATPDANPYAAPKARAEQPNSPDGERPLATRLSRLLAALIDSFIFVLLAILVVFFGGFNPDAGFAIMAVIGLVFMIIQLTMVWKRSQTIGKAMMKIRVEEYGTDRRAGPVKYIVLRIIVVGIIGSIPLIGPLFSIIDVLFIFGSEQRCVHDHIAGTVVRVAP